MRLTVFFLIMLFFGQLSAIESFWIPGPCDLIPPWYERIRFEAAVLYDNVSAEDWNFFYKKTVKGRNTKQRYRDVSLGWAPGYRIGFQWMPPHNDWELGFHWTHYDARGSNHHTARGKEGQAVSFSIPIISNFLMALNPGQAVRVRGRIKTRFEIYDLDLSSACCRVAGAYIRPVAGIRLLDVHENWKTKSAPGPGFPIYSIAIHLKNEHKGIGFKAGLKSGYALCDGLSIIGGMTGALIWGNVEFKNKYIALLGTSQVIRPTIRENVRLIRPMLDLAAGLEWCCIVCDCNPVKVSLEWEFHCLFNQFRYFISPLPTNAVLNWKADSNVILQGLALTGSFEF